MKAPDLARTVSLVLLATILAAMPGYATASESRAVRPLWQACAHALDPNSRLDVERLSSLIDSGTMDRAHLAAAYKDRGCIHEYLAEDEAAVADYSEALALVPNDAEAYFIRARTYGNGFKYALAVADYDAAIRLAPGDAESYYRRGHVYEDGFHDPEKAVADYTASLRLDPNDPATYGMRAIAYFNLGRAADAAADKAKEKLLEAAPSNQTAMKRAAGEWE